MEYLGIVSVVILIFSLIAVQAVWGPDYTKTFSRLVARKKSSTVAYFLLFTIFLSLFTVYITCVFIPKLGLSDVFLSTFIIGVVAQFVCVIVPEIGGLKTRIHLVAASIMSVSVFAQVAIILFATELSLIAFLVNTSALVIMVAVVAIVLFRLRIVRHELALQSVYFLAYLGAILAVGYLS